MEDSYREWSVRIQQMQAKYPGYRGMYLQPPEPGSGGHWTTMLRYDTHEHLEGWLNCTERREMLKESHAFIEDLVLMRLATSFPGWVPVNPSTGQGPPNWKAALLVLLGLYPIVMFEMHFTLPLFDWLGVAHPLATFISNFATVMITGYLTMPPFVRWFRWWLFVTEDSPPHANAKGLGILIALYLTEIALSWLLLS
jgi:antibiotic biosynthesis monooxygenase (ABM) superfamily enzyme